ncbi:E3 ubiquitin-protein ligase BRE1-like 2 isoform X2 [Medicago truncatula]|nr:E3 ubiquitin-protein ligase BRE1-like 2 isoform X2 [Medicago truncatula]
MQKDAAMGMNSSNADAVNGKVSPEKPAERAMGLSELKNSIEEVKIVNADRLSELQDSGEENQILTKQFEELQNELNDDKYVRTSRVYSLAKDQLQHWIAELDRFKSLTESLQASRTNIAKREKELNSKLESAVNARHIHDISDSRTDELKIQLQKCINERNDLEIKMEEAKQDIGRKDIKAEFGVMSSALSKEMGMMETQLKRWKDAAHEAVSLRAKAHSLREKLSGKTSELKSLANKCAEQDSEIKSSKAMIEKLQEENQELEFVLDMYGLEDYQKSLPEVRESESKAHSQAEMLKKALDEHGLELRVRAANEAEAACEQRLSAAEAEIEELRAQLDANERKKLEMTEAIKAKEAEAETYISEIETIGQAYEDMQTQHQRLLQQVAERDDCNIKLVSESMKAKHLHSTLLSEKQAFVDQLQKINSLIENSKKRIANSEEQIKHILSEAAKCTHDEKHLAAALEFARWELADAEKELKLLKSVASASEKEYEQIQKDVEAFEKELDSERSSRKKLEEELMEVNNQITELNSDAKKTAVQQLEEEIRVCKNMIKCTVCSDRPKEVVIVKCYHLFCNPCIQRNLELRHRKCPACGTAFGQSDVRFVKI